VTRLAQLARNTCTYHYDEVTNKPFRPNSLFEHIKLFFLDTAKPIEYFGERLKVEVETVLRDYVDFTKKTQFGLYDPGIRPEELEFIMIEPV
jgi:hypothetical protein